MKTLPEFSLHSYENLLRAMKDNGYQFCNIRNITTYSNEKVVFLRHDVDLHLTDILQMAEIEASMGYSAAYYTPHGIN
jgi:hypothetical protein